MRRSLIIHSPQADCFILSHLSHLSHFFLFPRAIVSSFVISNFNRLYRSLFTPSPYSFTHLSIVCGVIPALLLRTLYLVLTVVMMNIVYFLVMLHVFEVTAAPLNQQPLFHDVPVVSADNLETSTNQFGSSPHFLPQSPSFGGDFLSRKEAFESEWEKTRTEILDEKRRIEDETRKFDLWMKRLRPLIFALVTFVFCSVILAILTHMIQKLRNLKLKCHLMVNGWRESKVPQRTSEVCLFASTRLL